MSAPPRRFPKIRTLVRAGGLAVWFTLASPASAQEDLADLAPFREGCQALADERFETAVARFRECWDLLRDSGGDGPESNFVAARLLEALVRDGSSSSAVAWVSENEGFQPTPATSYWIAVAFQAEERFAEAAEQYQFHLAATATPDPATLLNRAVCLARSGQAESAFDLVRERLPAEPVERLRLAQIAASASHPAEALAFLGDPDPADPAWSELRLPLVRVHSALLVRRGDRAGALASVLRLIETSPDPESARRAFLLLEVFLDGQRPALLAERFAAWEEKPDFPGREAARLYRHHLLEAEPARSEALRALAAASADPDLKLEALMRLEPSGGAAVSPDTIAPDVLERLEFARGSAAYRAGRFDEAARHFSGLAERARGEAADRNLFNAALAALRQDDATAFAAFEEALARNHPRSGLLADLSYLGGLYFAAKGDATAFDRLNRFVLEHPGHDANIDARLALAEIHLNQAPARPREAREIFEGLRTRPLTLAQSERLDYTSVWVEVTDGDGPELIRRAGEFVANWPSSAYLGEVLVILASEHYARKNFSAAAAAFRRVATEFPDSPHAETARFFAAKASPPADETVAAWRLLVGANGLLANEASHELGLLFLSLDRFKEARDEFEGLLGRLAPEAPLRFAVMADLAYAHYLEALAAGKDPVGLEEAANRFAALSGLDAAPALWRYNAAVRRGKCLEALGKAPIALEIYRSIVEESRSGSEGGVSPLAPGETEWLFRAGFAAIEILTAEKNWVAAIEVADALSEKSGPRAIEATRLAERLRLKHWVWD